ncbi:hypothetical protein GCM10027290_20140 [Micromonospora sonneratiae]|uniref:Lytic transglycosylase domain-containing protein n=1 Tax=Micromonospora sonneratiae TaxID=1184706 RepID=A0ABW3YIJ0_9ACTN
MSRLWSRYGIRTLAIALLAVGVAGGYYLGEDREAQQQGIDAQLAANVDRAELDYQRDRQAVYQAAIVRKRAAEHEAAVKAAEAAKAAAERARKAEAAAATRKKEREEAVKPYTGPIPASCNEYSGNRQIGCALLLDAGFGLDQMPCLDKLWTKESGWNVKAKNSSSGAYGIPQALPGDKMGPGWQNSAEVQIRWGLGYIKARYDTPCGAWSYFQAKGYY